MDPLVVFHPSDRTPRPDAFAEAARQVVREQGATWLDDDHLLDLRLADGTEIEFDVLEIDEGAYAVLDQPYEPAIDLIYALADRTACFVSIETAGPDGTYATGAAALCALPSTGAALPENQASQATPKQLADRRAFGDWLRVVMIEARRARPTPLPAPPRRPKRSLMQRLSDALFGKEM